MDRQKILVFLLRLAGVSMGFATLAIFLPTDLMDTIHASFGLGPLPRAPITEYLTRSVAAVYAMHGGMFLVVSYNLPACRPVVTYLGFANICFGIFMVGIDIFAGLPWYWTCFEGPPIAMMGMALLWASKTRAGNSDTSN